MSGDRPHPRRYVLRPEDLVPRLIARADEERLHAALLDVGDSSPSTRRLRELFAARERVWRVGATWLTGFLGEDDDTLWGLFDRWHVRADTTPLEDERPVWLTMASDLALCLVLRGSFGTPGPGGEPDRNADGGSDPVDGRESDEDTA